MDAPQNFRSAFNGFNREDVVNYISYISAKHDTELNELRGEAEELRTKLAATEDQTMIAATLKRGLEDVLSELEQCKAKCAALQSELDDREEVIRARDQELDTMNENLIAREEELDQLRQEAAARQEELARVREETVAGQEELNRANEKIASFREENARYQQEMAAQDQKLKAASDAKDAEIARLQETLEQNALEFAGLRKELEAARVLPVSGGRKNDFFGRWTEELNAYRRAESCERRARERVNQMYDQANGALAEASVRVEQTAGQISELAAKVESEVALLLKAMVDGKNTLADTAVMLGAIRPDMD